MAIDFETSGYSAHYACALGLVRIEGDSIVDEFYSLVRPPASRVYFTHIHGLTWDDLKDAPTFSRVWPEASRLLKGAEYLLAHNASFDRKVLSACCEVFGLDAPRQQFLCTLKGAKRIKPLASHSLNSLCQYFDIELEHHHALSDARACALIYNNLCVLGISEAEMLLGTAKTVCAA